MHNTLSLENQLFMEIRGIVHQITRSFLKEAVFLSVYLICGGGYGRLFKICWSDPTDLEFVGTKDVISSFKYILISNGKFNRCLTKFNVSMN